MVLLIGLIIIVILIISLLNFTGSRDPSSIGKAGESEVSSVLHSLPEEYLVLDDVTIPDSTVYTGKKYTTQIDHVVVSPYGIFVIETKNYSGWIFGSEKSNQWKETFKTTEGHFLYNPIKQNWGHIFALAEHLHLKTGLFKPIVVFSNDCELHVEATTPVIKIYQLKGHILSYTQEVMSQKDAASIFERIKEIRFTGEEIEEKHIQSIGERHSEKEMNLRNGICPRCGGRLVLRNGRYGSFYGCSNYPRCKFTKDVAHGDDSFV